MKTKLIAKKLEFLEPEESSSKIKFILAHSGENPNGDHFPEEELKEK